uniref:Tubulin glycylase 3B n=1 Tax=Stomoxys calcitrans TaxID=35570 RepID=A0A1I8P137_STOCA|nr:unnamed protein product [Stomoxys calcitrans]
MPKKQENHTKTLLNIYRNRSLDAYRNKRIFTMFRKYSTIRKALLKRGWLEKLPRDHYAHLQTLPEETLLQYAKRGNVYETVLISRMLDKFPAFFVWQTRIQRDLYGDVKPYRNCIRRSPMVDFTTKVGLIGCMEQVHWHGLEEGVAKMSYPRAYRLYEKYDEKNFIDDFRLTQCQALIRFLINNQYHIVDLIDIKEGTIRSEVVKFAIDSLKRQTDESQSPLSLDSEPQPVTTDEEWNAHLADCSRVISSLEKIKCNHSKIMQWIEIGQELLSKIEVKRIDLKWDGWKNLWILKPGYKSRGIGIVIRSSLDEILNWSSAHTDSHYIVQKYLERPLLIYQTKFDIRQYMLISIRESTVQIWLYRDCYLRFSSQQFCLDDLRECVHLTNNSVQKKYKTNTTRDPRLPKSNMWCLDQFKVYMKTQNVVADVWQARVYAGFRENLIAVVLASLDRTILCENCFQLYGCDFMLDEEYNPILIEINSSPDLSPSTEVTARICPMVLEDCIKVIVDLSRNSRALTGLFEMIFEVNYKFKPNYNVKEGLNITGKSIDLCPRRSLTIPPKTSKKRKRSDIEGKQTGKLDQKHLSHSVIFRSVFKRNVGKTRKSYKCTAKYLQKPGAGCI